MGPRVGLLWREEWDPAPVDVSACRLHGVFAAFAGLGVAAEPVVYSDDAVERVREQLLALDGVLVWVNPIEQGLDRSRLDPLLCEVAAAGVWVSAHPDVIARLATKRVLFDTRALGWGTDTRLYTSAQQLQDELPARLEERARVLKQERGMGGQGVWKVELEQGRVRVEHAADGLVEHVPLDELGARFAQHGLVVEQPFEPRVAEGMIRVYLTHDRVVGFAHQYPRGLRPADAGDAPTGKTFEPPTVERYADLRAVMERDWVPAAQRLLGIETAELPVIWDADFLRREQGYMLCEINASSTFAFPERAMPGVARATLGRIAGNRSTESAARAST